MRPTFNVTEFQEVVHVQMNRAMRDLLVDLIDDFDNDNLEPELRALRKALQDPQGAQLRRATQARESRFRNGNGNFKNYERRHTGDSYNSNGDRE